ncbi:RISC-loading complex subunit tarbp2-like [Leptopilina boulardi]|uniref:RISC-loading complex subunit tarbp2-like n=1 Tax=Leptopilina boulardi TaxID=63433 RepID=UPI0021F62ECA|nr:RISC-loading complex subunit tarbp2-like [Leptopilina boulardi]
MEKTPIALLGEYTVKRNPPLPNYIYLGDRMIGANDHEFSFKIIYHEFSVIGKGPTKQMAKHNAAQEMLTLLGQNNSSNNNIKSLLTSTNSLNIQNESPETGINYIGLIHELCAKKKIKSPEFNEKISCGPHHMNFKIKCQVGDIIEEGIERTKKQAKSEAAKKVWFKLKEKYKIFVREKVETVNEEFGLNVEDIIIEDILPDYKNENKIALENYLKLTKLTITPLLSENINIENCHRIFTSEKYDTTIRQRILHLLADISTISENTTFIEKYLLIINRIAKILNVELKPLNLQLNRFANTQNVSVNYAAGYKLYTEPAITGIGVGETLTLARLRAILSIQSSIKVLLI